MSNQTKWGESIENCVSKKQLHKLCQDQVPRMPKKDTCAFSLETKRSIGGSTRFLQLLEICLVLAIPLLINNKISRLSVSLSIILPWDKSYRKSRSLSIKTARYLNQQSCTLYRMHSQQWLY